MIFCRRSYMCPEATEKMWIVSGSSSGLRPPPELSWTPALHVACSLVEMEGGGEGYMQYNRVSLPNICMLKWLISHGKACTDTGVAKEHASSWTSLLVSPAPLPLFRLQVIAYFCALPQFCLVVLVVHCSRDPVPFDGSPCIF